MINRQVYRDIVRNKLLQLELGWLFRQVRTYGALKLEKVLMTGKAPGPLMGICILTENCNLRCPMCDLPIRFKESLSQQDTATWKRVIDDMYDMGVSSVGFTGGEVTMREDIFELIGYARKYGMPVTLNTNALGLTDRRIPDLIAANPTNLNISIDSGRDDVNDQLRGGKRILSRTLSRIERLIVARQEYKADFTITVVTVLSDQNIGDLEILFERVASAGADRIGFMPLHDIAHGRCSVAPVKLDTAELAPTIRDLSRKFDLPIENSDSYLDDFHPVMSGATKMPPACNAGYTSIVIGPDLKVYRCWPYFEKRQPFRKFDPEITTLKALWNDDLFRQERRVALACKECFWNCHSELSYLV